MKAGISSDIVRQVEYWFSQLNGGNPVRGAVSRCPSSVSTTPPAGSLKQPPSALFLEFADLAADVRLTNVHFCAAEVDVKRV
jgi:hypothetical protein